MIAAVAATIPLLEMGINDDWSYAWTARAYANTGHLAYNGWVGAIVGAQAIWGGLLIRAFGFSFTLLRLSTLPFAAGIAVLLYRLGRYAGLTPQYALFGTVTVTLSPLFIPLAASYMTDVPGLFFWLATLYCAVLAVRARGATAACGWMAAAAVLGVIGGTVRQVIWIAPLLALPTVAWIRRERATSAASAGLCCAAAVAMALCLRWFQAQTGSGGLEGEPLLDFVEDALETLLQMILGCLMFLLPALAIHLADWRKRREELRPLFAAMVVAGVVLALVVWWFQDDLLLGNLITAIGILDPRLDAMGQRPEILGKSLRAALGVTIVISAGFAAAPLLDDFWRNRRNLWARIFHAPRATHGRLRLFLWLMLPPTAIYAAALIYRGIVFRLFDRYLIVLLPALIIPLLWRRQEIARRPLPWFGWILAAVFAWFGIAITHDYIAAGRARLQAARALTDAGIPRHRISAGLEYDAWTQLDFNGKIRLRTDSDAPYPIRPGFWFWQYTPDVNAAYVVAHSKVARLEETNFRPVEYIAWLPPFHRWIYTLKVPGTNTVVP